MILTIKPAKTVAEELEIEGGIPSDGLHLTLFYIDKKDESFKNIIKCCEALLTVLKTTEPIDCTVTKIKRFKNVKKMMGKDGMEDATEPTDVVYGEVEGEGLHTLRKKLEKTLVSLGVPFSTTHKEFKPHISLKYVPSGDEVEEPKLPIDFTVKFVEIWVESGDRKHAFALGG